MEPKGFHVYAQELSELGKAAFRDKHGDRFLIITSAIGARGSANEMETTANTAILSLPVPLDDEPVVILGRKSECDLVIPDQSVSGRHASFRISKGVVHVVDLNSSNGTFIDEWRLDPEEKGGAPLGDRHALRFGSISCRYVADEFFFRFAATLLPEDLKD